MSSSVSRQRRDLQTVNPVWMETPLPRYTPLAEDLAVDAVIVGGGLTGITAAHLLCREGMSVALLERDRLASADTGRTTAHLAYVTDDRLHSLVPQLGREAAQAFWQAGAQAIEQIAGIAAALGADCGLKRVPGYLHAPVAGRATEETKEVELLQKDAELAHELGFDATFLTECPLVGRPGVRFDGQARFNPRGYLRALLAAIEAAGGRIFEDTSWQGNEGHGISRANGRTVRWEHLMIATHSPILGPEDEKSVLHTELTLYTSYVLGAVVPGHALQETLFWDTGDPYDYLRIDDCRDGQYVIFGGNDVKADEAVADGFAYAELGQRLQRLLPDAAVSHRWQGQLVETSDGLPFIGTGPAGEFVATGFCGNGFTLGTLAAMMARDHFLGRKNDSRDAYRLDRRLLSRRQRLR